MRRQMMYYMCTPYSIQGKCDFTRAGTTSRDGKTSSHVATPQANGEL